MADLTNILKGDWRPPRKVVPPPPHDTQLKEAIERAGLEPPLDIQMDGQIHRFYSGGGKRGDKTGWYVAFGDGVPAGRFGCWRNGVELTWKADIGRDLTFEEDLEYTKRWKEAQKIRDEQKERQHQIAAETVEKIWSSGSLASSDHPYLNRKGIDSHGARVTGDGRLMVPLYTIKGEISSIQYIDIEGGKLYHPGGATGGKFWMIGNMDEPGPLYIAEGYATACTIHESTGRPCVVSYSASNLVPVTGTMKKKFPNQEIIIIADHDLSGVGQRYGEQASAKYGVRMIMPPILGDANDYVQAGHDLASLLMPDDDNDYLEQADQFCNEPAPVEWLVKRWLQRKALIMVHGPSGSGKSFIVLDWCLRISSGISDWMGCKVNPGKVIYLAGEGHHGMKGRVAAWKTHHTINSLDMWISKSGCDLNTNSGYLKVVESVRKLKENPVLIVVDTLHRFFAGDENSSQDTKTMLDACGMLMMEFNCSVILVHHTGLSGEAQQRARGSSSWKGALDIEISVIPGKDDKPIKIVLRKTKDSEEANTVHVDLLQVDIPGWFDEDGLQVNSAVIVEAEAHQEEKKPSAVDNHWKTFQTAWWASGAEIRNDLPFLRREGLREKLKIDGGSASHVRNSLSTDPRKLIGCLLLAEIITPHENGWVVCNSVYSSVLLIQKNA